MKNQLLIAAIFFLIIISLSGCTSPQMQDKKVVNASTSASTSPSLPAPTPEPTPVRTSPGEVLFIGELGAYASDGYYYEKKETDVVDLSYEALTVSFVLSEDKATVRDIKIEAKDMAFIVGRNGEGQQANFNYYNVGYPNAFDLLSDETLLSLQKMEAGGDCFLTLTLNGDTASGTLHFVFEHDWMQITKIPIDFGTRDINFTIQR